MNNSLSVDLIARAQNGSPSDVGAIYLRYHQNIYRYLYYRTGDQQTAEDLTSDVFLKMIQALPSYHAGSIPFEAWLFQVARNLAIDHYRRTNSHPVAPIDESFDGEDTNLEGKVDLRLSNVELSQSMVKIEESQRDVLLLRFIEGMPIAETAAILHKSEDAVKALQRRGLMALRKLMSHPEVDLG